MSLGMVNDTEGVRVRVCCGARLDGREQSTADRGGVGGRIKERRKVQKLNDRVI
jgi:hypothetical protein